MAVNLNNILFFGLCAVLVGGAYYGVDMVMKAQAREDARVEAINSARAIGTFIAEDEASFGTGFRDAVTVCIANVTDVALPKAVQENYLAVLKSAVTIASDENFDPRNGERWLAEAHRKASMDNPLPEEVFKDMDQTAKEKLNNAIFVIDRKIGSVGNCLLKTAQK